MVMVPFRGSTRTHKQMVKYHAPVGIQKNVTTIDELLTDAALEALSKINLAQLLENPAAACETLSLIQNVPKFSRNYKLTNEQVAEVIAIQNASSLVPRHAYNLAFDVINALKKARREFIDSYSSAAPRTMWEAENGVERPTPKPLPAKPQAQPMTPEKAKQAVEVFLNHKMKANEQTFTFEECCNAIKDVYLETGDKRWHDTDLVEVNNQTPKWKQSVSAALSFFSDKETVSFVHRRILWMIIPL